MPTPTLAGAFGEIRAASTSGGGTALTTTASQIVLPNGTHHVFLLPRNFSTAVVVKTAKCPYLAVVKTLDNGATGTDYADEAQDGSASTTVRFSSIGTAAQGNYLYVGSWMPFRGVVVTTSTANANASVLTVNYWNGSAWASASATDGTASGGASLAVNGNVTWTVPTAWSPTTLMKTTSPSVTSNMPYATTPTLYWTRWEFSATLDASADMSAMIGLPPSTSYAEWTSGLVIEDAMVKGPGHWAAIEALADAGTANLIVNAAVSPDRAFP